jgi:hypothetical protein
MDVNRSCSSPALEQRCGFAEEFRWQNMPYPAHFNPHPYHPNAYPVYPAQPASGMYVAPPALPPPLPASVNGAGYYPPATGHGASYGPQVVKKTRANGLEQEYSVLRGKYSSLKKEYGLVYDDNATLRNELGDMKSLHVQQEALIEAQKNTIQGLLARVETLEKTTGMMARESDDRMRMVAERDDSIADLQARVARMALDGGHDVSPPKISQSMFRDPKDFAHPELYVNRRK